MKVGSFTVEGEILASKVGQFSKFYSVKNVSDVSQKVGKLANFGGQLLPCMAKVPLFYCFL